MKEVYRLKEDLFTKDSNYIPSGTLFCLHKVGEGDNCYVSVFGSETKMVWMSSDELESQGKREVEVDPFFKKILFLVGN
jgi:hypothetical protein|tara:strand:- start:18647 stop:18883 length:237 start_codon:yes stop_codon:yes gene_type:complete